MVLLRGFSFLMITLIDVNKLHATCMQANMQLWASHFADGIKKQSQIGTQSIPVAVAAARADYNHTISQGSWEISVRRTSFPRKQKRNGPTEWGEGKKNKNQGEGQMNAKSRSRNKNCLQRRKNRYMT